MIIIWVSSKGGILTHCSFHNGARQWSVLPSIVSDVYMNETLLKLKQHDNGVIERWNLYPLFYSQ